MIKEETSIHVNGPGMYHELPLECSKFLLTCTFTVMFGGVVSFSVVSKQTC